MLHNKTMQQDSCAFECVTTEMKSQKQSMKKVMKNYGLNHNFQILGFGGSQVFAKKKKDNENERGNHGYNASEF